MRPLKIAKPSTPTQEAEAAAARRWLEQQAVPAGASEAEVAARFRYVVAVTKQYQGHGLGLLELVMAGWRAGLVLPDLWALRVREGMAGAVENR